MLGLPWVRIVLCPPWWRAHRSEEAILGRAAEPAAPPPFCKRCTPRPHLTEMTPRSLPRLTRLLPCCVALLSRAVTRLYRQRLGLCFGGEPGIGTRVRVGMWGRVWWECGVVVLVEGGCVVVRCLLLRVSRFDSPRIPHSVLASDPQAHQACRAAGSCLSSDRAPLPLLPACFAVSLSGCPNTCCGPATLRLNARSQLWS